jgi:hypothetical protein
MAVTHVLMVHVAALGAAAAAAAVVVQRQVVVVAAAGLRRAAGAPVAEAVVWNGCPVALMFTPMCVLMCMPMCVLMGVMVAAGGLRAVCAGAAAQHGRGRGGARGLRSEVGLGGGREPGLGGRAARRRAA